MAVRLGDDAPNFTAETTEGEVDFYDWKGDSWAVLFSHPKDFTPVCTTELGTVAKLKPEFDKRNVKVIGLSVDPLDSHGKWAKDIEETQGAAPNFPLIADPDRKVADLYDMIQPNASDTMTVRSVFIDRPRQQGQAHPHLSGQHRPQLRRDPPGHRLAAAHGQAQGGDPGRLEGRRGRHHRPRRVRRGGQGEVRRLHDHQAVPAHRPPAELIPPSTSARRLGRPSGRPIRVHDGPSGEPGRRALVRRRRVRARGPGGRWCASPSARTPSSRRRSLGVVADGTRPRPIPAASSTEAHGQAHDRPGSPRPRWRRRRPRPRPARRRPRRRPVGPAPAPAAMAADGPVEVGRLVGRARPGASSSSTSSVWPAAARARASGALGVGRRRRHRDRRRLRGAAGGRPPRRRGPDCEQGQAVGDLALERPRRPVRTPMPTGRRSRTRSKASSADLGSPMAHRRAGQAGDQGALVVRRSGSARLASRASLQHGHAPRRPDRPPRAPDRAWSGPGPGRSGRRWCGTGRGPRGRTRPPRAVRPDQQRTPERQQQHHALAPTVAALAGLDQHLLAQLVGPGQVALDEADVGQQAERPAQPAHVADLGEGVGRAGQAALGLGGAALDERDPGQVLQRPGLAAAVADLARRRPARRGWRPRPRRSRRGRCGPCRSRAWRWPRPARRRGAWKCSTASSRVASAAARSPPSRSTSPRTSRRAGQDRLVAQLEGQVVGRVDVGPGLGDGSPLGRHRRAAQQQVGPSGRSARGRAAAGPGCRDARPRAGPGPPRRDGPPPRASRGPGPVTVVGHAGHRRRARPPASAAAPKWKATMSTRRSWASWQLGDGGRQVGGDAVVAPGPVGLGQRAVGHLADEVGAERPVLAVDLEDLLVGEPVEHRGRGR